VPGLQYQVDTYAGKIRALSILWFVYAAVALVGGVFRLNFAHALWFNHLHGWNSGPWPGGIGPDWFFPAFLHAAWIFLLIRTGFALAAGWALMERSRSGRVLAIVAAFFSLFHPLIGTALGIWTLVVLLGYRNTTLYEQLP
jgi:hypothetical protein